ncbi:unnamed protein product [Ilex paraguariensis]|uniref:DC1 domain-containing protein n=1 Tax=Ilex paraguariensis TaxID=185542 RepID=A0ABC8T0W2_9AQUA
MFCLEFCGFRCGENENEVDKSTDPNLLHLPMTNGSLELFRHFAKQINLEDIEREAELIHWSHEHPLILFDVQKDDDIKDEITLCDGCVQPISFPFYCCSQCNYFLHLSCVNLPRELRHPIHHEHPMVLCQVMKFYKTFLCDACCVWTNGFYYNCETCKFILDVKCAFLPTSIAHQAHKNPLVQMKGSKHLCNGSGFSFSTSGFKCDDCRFKISHDSALLPGTIRHRLDKHPLILCYPPFFKHVDEFHCEICEREMNPSYWLYYCSDCDQSFHLLCIKDYYSNVKYGGTIEVNCHPHSLAFVRKARKRFSYCSCGHSYVRVIFVHTDIDIECPIFECGECNYTLCLDCI